MPTFRLIMLALAALVGLGLTRPASAHPHVTVETEARLVFDAQGQVVGLEHVWTFDEMYSSFALQGLDTNRDGQYSREELAELTQINVENLAQQKFFTVMRHERRFVSFATPRDAWGEVKDGKLILHFTAPIATPFKGAGRPMTVEIYDPDFFVAFTPAEGEPMRLVSAPTECRIDYVPPRGGAVNPGTLSESFFQSLNSSANFGQQFAGKFTVLCP